METVEKQERLLLLALIAYVNDPSAYERNKRASSEIVIERASEKKKGNNTAAFILLTKGLICLRSKIFNTVPGCPRAARARI